MATCCGGGSGADEYNQEKDGAGQSVQRTVLAFSRGPAVPRPLDSVGLMYFSQSKYKFLASSRSRGFLRVTVKSILTNFFNKVQRKR